MHRYTSYGPTNVTAVAGRRWMGRPTLSSELGYRHTHIPPSPRSHRPFTSCKCRLPRINLLRSGSLLSLHKSAEPQWQATTLRQLHERSTRSAGGSSSLLFLGRGGGRFGKGAQARVPPKLKTPRYFRPLLGWDGMGGTKIHLKKIKCTTCHRVPTNHRKYNRS